MEVSAKELALIEQAESGAAVWSLNISDYTYNDSGALDKFWRSGQMKSAVASDFAHFARTQWYEQSAPPTEDKEIFRQGRYIEDALTMSQDELNEKYFVWNPNDRPDLETDFTRKENKAWKAELFAANEGKPEINLKGVECLERMLPTAFERVLFEKIRNGEADSQVTCLWNDPETDVPLRSRTDFSFRQSQIILDVKSTKCQTKEQFKWDALKLMYPQQALQQIEGMKISGYFDASKPVDYYWLGISKVAPFNTFLVQYSLDTQKLHTEKYLRAPIAMVAKFLKLEYKAVEIDGEEDELLII